MNQRDTIEKALFNRGINLPNDFWHKMETFEKLVRTEARKRDLLSDSDIANIFVRHILDSLAPLFFVSIPCGTEILDYGSGAGFPGIVLACVLTNSRFVLAESKAKKVQFLMHAVNELELRNAEVFAGRAEEVNREFDFIMLRATGPLKRTIPTSLRLLRNEGKLVVWVGPKFVGELDWWRKFLRKRGAEVELKPYPDWLSGDRKLSIAVIAKNIVF